MLTVRKGSLAVGDVRSALAQAEYLVDELDSPGAFGDNPDGLRGPRLSDGTPSSMWLGSVKALEQMEVKLGAALKSEVVALALQGLSASGNQIRKPAHDRINTPELHMAPPKDVSWLLAAADGDPQLQAAIQHVVLRAANQTVSYLVGTKDVMYMGRDDNGNALYGPAKGFVATASLQMTSRVAEGEIVPSPQLHVHIRLIGVEKPDGTIGTANTEALFGGGTPVEGGAVFRSLVAQGLRELGFGIRAGTGSKGRFFEVEGIREDLRRAGSGRTRQIERERAAIEAQLGRELSNKEAAELALKDRRTKDSKLPRPFVRAVWRAIAAERGGLTLERVWSLRRQRTLPPLQERLAWARFVALERFRERGPTVSLGEANAIVIEAGTGSLSVRECNQLLIEMQRSGEVIALAGGLVTTKEIREQEQRVIGRVLRAARRGSVAISPDAVEAGLPRASEAFGFELDSDEGGQEQAVRKLCSGVGFGVLHGRAGTGKGPVLRAITEAKRADGWQVIAAAADSRTQGVMAKQTGVPAYTLASLIDQVEQGSVRLNRKTVIIIDEASKVSGEDWDTITRWLEQYGVELILAGHIGQHDAIQLPGMFDEFVRQRDPDKALTDVLVPVAELTKIRRHKKEWQEQLQVKVDLGLGEDAVALLRKHEAITVSETPEKAMQRTAEKWDQARGNYKDPKAAIMVVSGSNDDVDKVNTLAQERRLANTELGDRSVQAVDRNYRIYPGDLVVLAAAPYRFPRPPGGGEPPPRVANGTIGIVTSVDSERDLVRVALSEPGIPDREVEIDQAELRARAERNRGRSKVPALRLAYAHHTFPIQGETVEEVFFCVVTMPSKNAFYVGITREHSKLHVEMHRMVRGEKLPVEDLFKALAWKISQVERPKISIRHNPISHWVAERLPGVTPYPYEQPSVPLGRQRPPASSSREQATILGRLTVAFGAQRANRFAEVAQARRPEASQLDYARLGDVIDRGLRALDHLNVDAASDWTRNNDQREALVTRISQATSEAEALETRATDRSEGGDKRQHAQLLQAAATHRESATQRQEELAGLLYQQRKLEASPDSPQAWLERNEDRVVSAIAAQTEQQTLIAEAAAAVPARAAVLETVREPPLGVAR